MQQHQLVAEVRQELQGAFAIRVVQKIGNDDQQAALRIAGDELARDLKIVGAAGGLQVLQKIHGGNKSVPPASGNEGVAQIRSERLYADGIQSHQPDIAQRGRQLARVVEL